MSVTLYFAGSCGLCTAGGAGGAVVPVAGLPAETCASARSDARSPSCWIWAAVRIWPAGTSLPVAEPPVVVGSAGAACDDAGGDAAPGLALDCAITTDGTLRTNKHNTRFRLRT